MPPKFIPREEVSLGRSLRGESPGAMGVAHSLPPHPAQHTQRPDRHSPYTQLWGGQEHTPGRRHWEPGLHSPALHTGVQDPLVKVTPPLCTTAEGMRGVKA